MSNILIRVLVFCLIAAVFLKVETGCAHSLKHCAKLFSLPNIKLRVQVYGMGLLAENYLGSFVLTVSDRVCVSSFFHPSSQLRQSVFSDFVSGFPASKAQHCTDEAGYLTMRFKSGAEKEASTTQSLVDSVALWRLFSGWSPGNKKLLVSSPLFQYGRPVVAAAHTVIQTRQYSMSGKSNRRLIRSVIWAEDRSDGAQEQLPYGKLTLSNSHGSVQISDFDPMRFFLQIVDRRGKFKEGRQFEFYAFTAIATLPVLMLFHKLAVDDGEESMLEDERYMTGSAGCLVANKGRVAIVTERFSGKKNFPGGSVDSPETPREAAKRETFEEAGLDVRVGRLIKQFPNNYCLYRCYANSPAEKLAPKRWLEIKTAEWHDPHKLKSENWRYHNFKYQQGIMLKELKKP